MGIRGLAADPKEAAFYSAALDQKVCKWNEKTLIWRTTTEVSRSFAGFSLPKIAFQRLCFSCFLLFIEQFQCVSAAVHPSSQAMAAGSVNGTIFILNTKDGNIVSQLPVSQVCIGCLSFSPDGDLLAAGCQDGVMYLLPVSEGGFAYEKVSVLKVGE